MTNMTLKNKNQNAFDVHALRKDFPILQEKVHGKPLVYLDSAATTQKPESVIAAITDFYRHYNANVHRGAHALSDKATGEFEAAREKASRFLNSPGSEQVIWTSGSTESVNIVAQTWGRKQTKTGDVILVSRLEHHSNIVPWQMLAQETGAEVKPIPVNDAGEIEMSSLKALMDKNVKLIAVNHVSNALGTVNPVQEIVQLAKAFDAKVFVDGAQAVAHFPVDVQALGCDFYAFSGHKLFGPTGIGVLWGKKALLENMPPWQGGGEMIEQVSFEGTRYNQIPFKFEAGTPNIAGVIGLGAAIDYLTTQDRQALLRHEEQLLQHAFAKAADFPGLKRIGTSANITGVFSFVMQGLHPLDIGMILDQQGIAVRTGHHCAQPIMEKFNVSGTVRASFSIYTTMEEVDALFAGLHKARSFLT